MERLKLKEALRQAVQSAAPAERQYWFEQFRLGNQNTYYEITPAAPYLVPQDGHGDFLWVELAQKIWPPALLETECEVQRVPAKPFPGDRTLLILPDRRYLLFKRGELPPEKTTLDAIRFNLSLPEAPAEFATFSREVVGQGRFVRQSSCPSSVGGVTMTLAPYQGESDFLLNWAVPVQKIPPLFLPAVVSGFLESAAKHEPPLKNLAITVTDGLFHEVDSSDISYIKATELAVKDALTKTSLIKIGSTEK